MKYFLPLLLLTLIPTVPNLDAIDILDYRQAQCLSEALYFEGRSESIKGQQAIAEVILNRVTSKAFPNTICSVVRQAKYYSSGGIDLHSCQFSYYCDGKPEAYKEGQAFASTYKLSHLIIDSNPTNLTQGATHYHTISTDPYWTSSLVFTIQIGNHLFYRKGGTKK